MTISGDKKIANGPGSSVTGPTSSPGKNNKEAENVDHSDGSISNSPPEGRPRPSPSVAAFLRLPPQNHRRLNFLNITRGSNAAPVEPVKSKTTNVKLVKPRKRNRPTEAAKPSKRRPESLESNSGPHPSIIPGTSASCQIMVESPVTSDSVTSDSPSDTEDKTCNSEDEHGGSKSETMCLTQDELNEREYRFTQRMRKKGLLIKPMGEDGACLFRAVADQVYGDQEMHSVIRRHCMDYIAQNRDYFSQYITEDFDNYLNRKRLENAHGNHIEIQALSEMYNRAVEVYCYGSEPINTFRGPRVGNANAPIRLSYHNGVHYNSLVDPNNATVGVGLGLPDFFPGSADKNLLSEAIRQSEDKHIEQAMLDDKLLATDWEATDDAINEQVAHDSYLQWVKDNETRRRRSPTLFSSSACPSSSAEMGSSSKSCSNVSLIDYGAQPNTQSSSPKKIAMSSRSRRSSRSCSPAGKQNSNELEIPSFVNQLPPEVFGMDDWEDSQGIMARVLAVSQQEYLDNLKAMNLKESHGSTSNTH